MKKLNLTSATVLFAGLILLAISLIFIQAGSAKPIENPICNDINSGIDNKGYWETGELALLSISDFSQDLNFKVKRRDLRDPYFAVTGRYSRPVKKEELNESKLISDVILGYPKNWLTDYVSVEILTTRDGETIRAVSPNDTLSEEQKNILKTVDLGADIVIKVNYKYGDQISGVIENKEIHVSMTVIPEVEAEYIGGAGQMTEYLRKKVISKISKSFSKEVKQRKVIFTVNEEGKIVDAKMFQVSGDPQTDTLLIDAISKMPKWKPAEDAKGVKVKQEFEFIVGGVKNGC